MTWPNPPQLPNPPRTVPDLPVAAGALDGITPVTPETTGADDDPVAWALHTLHQLTEEQRAEVLAYYRDEVAA